MPAITFLSIAFFSFSMMSFSQTEKNNEQHEITSMMLNAIDNVNWLSCTISNKERYKETVLTGKQFIKYSGSPKRCYIYLISPSYGSEVCYIEGQNANRLLYSPKGFPYFDINLDPLGSLVRRRNHHTVFEVGFEYFGSLIGELYKKYPDSFYYMGDTIWNGNLCYKLVVENDDFPYINYVVKKGESTRSIAKKHFINEYKIIEVNEALDDFTETLEPGQIINIPKYYAKKMIVFIDNKLNLPLFIKIFDDKGFFEQYEYTNIKVNSVFSEKDFIPDQAK